MSIYIIGDVQGCYDELQHLLKIIKFNPHEDRLGFVGDLVNRGPRSLDVLRFIKSLPSPWVVLGNHDLFLLILGYGLISENAYPHTLSEILHAPDKMELLDWLRHQPLIHHDEKNHTLLVHAGVPPQWNIQESIDHAREVEQALQGPHFKTFLTDLFGDCPNHWDSNLTGQERLRYITNALTRMRFCTAKGELDLKTNGNLNSKPNDYHPWFELRDAGKDQTDILFGHWAALNGQSGTPHCYALDTGCAWGHALTAIRLEDKQRFSIPCHQKGK